MKVSNVCVEASCLGFPRIGPKRELKRAMERFWSGKISQDELANAGKQIRLNSWNLQVKAGLHTIPCNDFSMFDHVLDAAVLVGAIAPRFEELCDDGGGNVSLRAYFAMARGFQGEFNGKQVDVLALEMKKWFDTNYHFMVPEVSELTDFKIRSQKPFRELREALVAGVTNPRPVLLGPVSMLNLSKPSSVASPGFKPMDLLGKLLPVYEDILRRLIPLGAKVIQFDEPVSVLDHDNAGDFASALKRTYKLHLAPLCHRLGAEIMIGTYFETPSAPLLPVLMGLPIDILHLDVSSPEKDAVDAFLNAISAQRNEFCPRSLSIGVVSGRNIWKVDADHALEILGVAARILSSKHGSSQTRLIVNTSCSLLHVPHSIDVETALPEALVDWLSFAVQKLEEVSFLGSLLRSRLNLSEYSDECKQWLSQNRSSIAFRRTSSMVHNSQVKESLRQIVPSMLRRASPVEQRVRKQSDLSLPLFPVTTIGSFPQTADIRKARSAFKKGSLDENEYASFIDAKTSECIAFQEDIGIDVLVHGEYERNDMVEFFGEHLSGYAFTSFGWVQSCGNLCVKPPILFGDVARKQPITVNCAKASASRTTKPMKGMLTGPITMMQWSFLRDDQSRAETCRQLALAVRQEVSDLEKEAGLRCIQIDEPAIREGLPIRKSKRQDYLNWAVDCFLLATTCVSDDTQVHTHLCYSDFKEIMPALVKMDVDVLSIESARSDLALISAFRDVGYAGQIGPGLFDIHSPRVPTSAEMKERVKKILRYVKPEQLWLNPDCGLKTRSWAEAKLALANLVGLAHELRQEYTTKL